eukprot:IDg23565t1
MCADVGLKPIFRPKKKGDSSSHAFGTHQNCSEPQKIIGRCVLPLPVGNGEWLPITAMVVDGNVPFMLGKDTLQNTMWLSPIVSKSSHQMPETGG